MNGHEVRSAGTEHGARIRMTAGHLGRADLVVAMEKRHVSRLRDKFADALAATRFRVADGRVAEMERYDEVGAALQAAGLTEADRHPRGS